MACTRLSFALALLSKESAVETFLPLVLLGDYATGRWKPRLRYAWIAGVTLLYLGLLWKVQGGRFGQASISLMDNPLASLSAGWRMLNAIRIAWKYVGLHFYPSVLSCDYSFNQIPVYLDWRHTLPAALAAVGAVIAAWIQAIRKRQTGLALPGGIYLVGFATTANILIPTGTIMGERLAYLPSVGFCLLIALAWIWLETSARVRWLGDCLRLSCSRSADVRCCETRIGKTILPFILQPCAPFPIARKCIPIFRHSGPKAIRSGAIGISNGITDQSEFT